MRRKALAALAMATVLAWGTACTPEPILPVPTATVSPGQPPLSVAGATVPHGVDPQEGVLLAHVYVAALNAAGVPAEVVGAAADTAAAISAVESGGIDVVPLYSRLALPEKPAAEQPPNPADVVAELRDSLPSGVELLDSGKAQDRTTLVVTAVTAQKYGLKSLRDAAKVCDKLVLGGPADFAATPPGLAELERSYDCEPKRFAALEPGTAYSKDSTLWQLLRDEINIAVMNSFSPAVPDNALVVLEDPESMFPAQDIVPAVASDKVTADVRAVINKVSAALTVEEMLNLTRLAQDKHFGDISEAAKAWLIQKGLIKASSSALA